MASSFLTRFFSRPSVVDERRDSTPRIDEERTALARQIAQEIADNPGTALAVRDGDSPLKKQVVKKAWHMARQYHASQTGRLFEDWVNGSTQSSGDTQIQQSGQRLRERARELMRDDPHIRSYRGKVINNVLGHKGMTLVSEAATLRGKPDEKARTAVELSWGQWCRKASLDLRHSMTDLAKHAVISRRVDGELLFKHIEGRAAGNPWNYALQPIEGDLLDYYHNEMLGRDPLHEIRMGVEMVNTRPVRYHLLQGHPGDYQFFSEGTSARRVPHSAESIIHYYAPDRPNDTRGVSELAAVIVAVKFLRGYDESVVLAARQMACHGVIYERETPDAFAADASDNVTLDDEGNEVEYDDDEDTIHMVVEPGQAFMAPMGTKPHFYAPTQPMETYPDFVKTQLRRIAAALGISYHSLTGDLEGVNFSSGRLGWLEDQEEWKREQELLENKLYDEVFPRWLGMALLSGQVKGYTVADYDRLLPHRWQPRRWKYMDPAKEANGDKVSLANGVTSPQAIIRAQGGDPEKVLDEQEEWQRELRRRGLAGVDNGQEGDGNADPNNPGEGPAEAKDPGDGASDNAKE